MRLLIKFLKILAYLSHIFTLVQTFVVLPYVHIDYAHYFRLAQCQARCTERYGVHAQKRLLDGSQKSFFNISNDEYKMCEIGCKNVNKGISNKRARSLSDAFKNGQEFGRSLGKDTIAPSGTSPILSLRVICMNMGPLEETGLLDSFQALITAELKTDFFAPTRYIVQWKQISSTKSLSGDVETKWITASIEPTNTFKVEGLQPGLKYRFMVTAILSNGKIGKGILSEWLEIPSFSSNPQQPVGPLNFKPQYNSDDGVSVGVRWNSGVNFENEKAILSSCHFQIAYANDSFSETNNFEQDESSGFLIKHLNYGTRYSVKVRAVHEEVQEFHPEAKWALEGSFNTITCKEIFGLGSLECDPEPVKNLSITIFPENSSVVISWTPSASVENILFYQLEYVSISKDPLCRMEQTTMTISATKTDAIFTLPSETECEFEIFVSNFDLAAREATVTEKFTYTPLNYDPNMSQIANLWLIIAPTSVVLFLCIILRLATCCHGRVKKWVKKNKETKHRSKTMEKPVMV